MKADNAVPRQASLAARFTRLAVISYVMLIGASLNASTDYAPAHYNEAYSGHWYTTGNGHQLCVIHDMEGYYLSTISYFQQQYQGTPPNTASVHYLVNSDYNSSDGAPAGDITQSVREANYAWHALCWNTWSFGTEHEGFASNPAWYTESMYQASALLQRHLCDTWGIPKDRNHIVGDNEWQNSTWTSWMAANLPSVDTTCNTHTDPGQYWDWTHFMALIGGTSTPEKAQMTSPTPGSTFISSSANFTWNTGSGASDYFLYVGN